MSLLPRSHRLGAAAVIASLALSVGFPAAAQVGIETKFVECNVDDLSDAGLGFVDAWTFVPDPEDDFLTQLGAEQSGVGADFDAAGACVGTGRLTGNAVKQLKRNHGSDAKNSWPGANAKIRKNDPVIAIVVPLHGSIELDEPADRQIWSGVDGKRAPGRAPGEWAGFFPDNRTVSMGGAFVTDDGVNHFTGTTDVGKGGRVFGAKAKDIGWSSQELNALVNISPLPDDSSSVRVAIATSVDDTFVLDYVGAGNDAARIALDSDFDTQGQLCYSVSSIAAGLDGGLATLRATAVYRQDDAAGAAEVDEAIARALLGSAADGATDLALNTWFNEDPGAGGLAVYTAMADVEPGSYMFDHFPRAAVTGGSGPRQGTFIVNSTQTGTFLGAPGCGSWHTPGVSCDYIDAGEATEWFELDPVEAFERSFTGSSGSQLCLLHTAGAAEPFAVLGIDPQLYAAGDHLLPPYQADCTPHAEHGVNDFGILTCGGDITSLITQVVVPFNADGTDEASEAPQTIAQRIWLDALHANGVDEDTILSEETLARVKALADDIGHYSRLDVGLRF